MYVGVTRPRDHLVLVLTGQSAEWLDELTDSDGVPPLSLSSGNISVCGQSFEVRMPPPVCDPVPSEVTEFGRPAVERVTHAPLRPRPSTSAAAGNIAVVETVNIGPRITLVGDPDLQAVGEAFHRFLACDIPGRDS